MLETHTYSIIPPDDRQIKPFLADTWWFGLTQRIDQAKFQSLAKTRADQGFSAIQIVVGIPPEVGPKNKNAASEAGVAWNTKGVVNSQYLELARRKIELLNRTGLTAILYGAWGHQINWIGVDNMKSWWGSIIKNTKDLDVIYCVSGESNLWIGSEGVLLPDKTTDNLSRASFLSSPPKKLTMLVTKVHNKYRELRFADKLRQRREKWSEVVKYLDEHTTKPRLLHTVPGETSRDAINNPDLLSAVTVQTGHNSNTREDFWKIPRRIIAQDPSALYINLEPWYEGIGDNFYTNDQLYAYWTTMLAGAGAYCYGAHGVWNMGDGRFLSHWGKQTLDQAMQLITPTLLGISNQIFTEFGGINLHEIEIQTDHGRLIKIKRASSHKSITYYPETQYQTDLEQGKYYLPSENKYMAQPPKQGQLVILSGT